METDTMNALQMIDQMDSTTRELIGFSLMGKINGRIAATSMRMAGRAQREGDGIDALNDALADFDEEMANRAFLNGTGVEVPSDDEALEAWVRTKEWLVSEGFRPSPLIETFRFMLERAGTRHASTDEQLDMMAKLSGMSVAAIKSAQATSTAREVARTKATVMAAIDLVEEVYGRVKEDFEGMQMTETGLVVRGTPWEPPAEFKEIVLAAIQSGKRSAIKIANSTEEALGSLALLRAAEDWT
jgi:hypothetical protein